MCNTDLDTIVLAVDNKVKINITKILLNLDIIFICSNRYIITHKRCKLYLWITSKFDNFI